MTRQEAEAFRAVVAPIVAAARDYATQARQRASAGNLPPATVEARQTYANGAADVALAVQLAAARILGR